MESSEVLDTIEHALSDASSKGRREIAIEGFKEFITELRKESGTLLELRKLNYQGQLASYEAQSKSDIELFKSVIEAGREALNALVLINGGAVVVLTGFLGAIAAKDISPALGQRLSTSLVQFGTGVLFGGLAFGARYISQAFFASKRQRVGMKFNIASVILAVVGYALFGFGVYGAHYAFSSFFAGR